MCSPTAATPSVLLYLINLNRSITKALLANITQGRQGSWLGEGPSATARPGHNGSWPASLEKVYTFGGFEQLRSATHFENPARGS